MHVAFLSIVDALASVLLLCTLWKLLSRKRGQHSPPGPTGLPVIGNVLDMPKSHEWETFSRWSERWGDIMSVTLFGQPIVVVNSLQIATDLLEKKIYSDRPQLLVAGNIIGWDRTLGLIRYGTVWREGRRLFSHMLGTRKSLEKLTEQLETESSSFSAHLLRDSEGLFRHARRFAAGLILSITYGYKAEREDDELVKLIDTAMENFSLTSAPGANFADMLPILKYVPTWFPGARWKRQALLLRSDLEAVCDIPFEFTKQQMNLGQATNNFVAINIEGETNNGRESILKDAAASMYAAGADTMASSICKFFLAMMCAPEIQEAAQRDIDRVIGNSRLPNMSDRDDLPYIRALTWEVLRWQPTVPLGGPHRLTQDDTYKGYYLPKGATVLANTWAMLRDPKRYTDPESFNPSRFLPSDGAEPEYDPRKIVFGFGRRVCPGSHLAEASLFLICASSLAAFRISKPVIDGKVIEPSLEFTTGTISHPRAFKCSITPRSAKAAALVSGVSVDAH